MPSCTITRAAGHIFHHALEAFGFILFTCHSSAHQAWGTASLPCRTLVANEQLLRFDSPVQSSNHESSADIWSRTPADGVDLPLFCLVRPSRRPFQNVGSSRDIEPLGTHSNHCRHHLAVHPCLVVFAWCAVGDAFDLSERASGQLILGIPIPRVCASPPAAGLFNWGPRLM